MVVDDRAAAAMAHPNEVFVRELYAAMDRGDGRAPAKALLPDTRWVIAGAADGHAR